MLLFFYSPGCATCERFGEDLRKAQLRLSREHAVRELLEIVCVCVPRGQGASQHSAPGRAAWICAEPAEAICELFAVTVGTSAPRTHLASVVALRAQNASPSGLAWPCVQYADGGAMGADTPVARRPPTRQH